MKSSHTSFLLDQPCLVAPDIRRTAFVNRLCRVGADPLGIVLVPAAKGVSSFPTGTDVAVQRTPSPRALAMTALVSWSEIGIGEEADAASDSTDLPVMSEAAPRSALAYGSERGIAR